MKGQTDETRTEKDEPHQNVRRLLQITGELGPKPIRRQCTIDDLTF